MTIGDVLRMKINKPLKERLGAEAQAWNWNSA